jgi:hypothetical protein
MKVNKLFLSILFGLMLFNQGLVAQDIKNMTLLGNYGRGEGESKSVFAAGSIVYYGLGSKLQIASFSDPSNPVKIGSVILSDVVEALVRTSVGGTQYIVASGGSKMWIINVQNPTTPSLLSTVDLGLGSTGEGIATSGTYAYVAAGDAGFKIYNIATPSAPVQVASIDSLAYCESVVISQPYAYIAANTTSNFQGRSFIIDISTPENPVYKSTIMGYGGYHQYMNVRSGYAFICDYNEGLQVINVSDVTNPTNVTTVPSGYRTASIIFDGNYGYIAVGDSGMAIYNVVNPVSPSFVTKIQTTGRAAFVSYGAITIGGTPTGHIFVANRNPAPGISAINVSNPAAPVTSAFLAALAAAPGIAYTPFYSDGKVYVAYGSAGLRIIDVSFPTSPTLLSTLALGGDSRAVVVSGNYAYVAARDSGVHIIDVTNAASPVKIKTIKTPRARGVAIGGTILYVAASDSGMGLIDISDPTNALLISYTGSSVYGENVTVDGNIVGLTDYDQIAFYDAATPTDLVKKGSTESLRIGNEGFAIDGDFVYVPDGDSLKIFSIANIISPTLVSKIWTGGYGYTCAIAGNYCYVASEATGVRAINISNPASPIEDGYYDFVAQSRGVTADGKYVYVAEKADGLTIYSNDLVTSVREEDALIPEQIKLNQNYPNPFNPSTNIVLELKGSAFVSLEVFNSLGQRVVTLLKDQLAAGSYNVAFDGSSLSTGVYMYRLQANGVTFAKKMTLIK